MRRVTALAAGAVLAAVTAHADMIELKSKGFLNGEVVSQDDREVHFKDASGKTGVYPKAEIVYMQIDKSDTGKKSDVLLKRLKVKIEQALEAVKKMPQALKHFTDAKTHKFLDAAGKPLDRSAVNAKSDALAKAMDEASQTSATLSKKNLTVNSELKKQKEYMDDQWGSGKKGQKSGRFSSLED